MDDAGNHASEVIGIGTDVVEVSRVERALDSWGNTYRDRLLVGAEREAYRSALDFAAVVAVKEATYKATAGTMGRCGWHDIEVLHGAAPTPCCSEIECLGRALATAARMSRLHFVSVQASREGIAVGAQAAWGVSPTEEVLAVAVAFGGRPR